MKETKNVYVVGNDISYISFIKNAKVVSSISDKTVIVAKYKSTPLKLLEKSKKALDKVGTKLAGVVLNHVDKEPNTYYYGYYKEQ